MGGRWAVWRSLLRIARRDAMRSKGRSAMVAVLVALPVLAASGVGVVLRSEQFDSRDVVATRLGDVAQALIEPGFDGVTPIVQSVDGSISGPADPARAGNGPDQAPLPPGLLPAGARVVPRLDVDTQDFRIRVGDRTVPTGVTEFAYDDPAVRGVLAQREGRAPGKAGEVAMSRRLAERLGVAVGDQVTLVGPSSRPVAESADAPARTLQVVGLVGGYQQGESVYGRPGDLVPPSLLKAWPSDFPPRNSYYVGGTPISWGDVQKLNAVGLSATSREVLEHPPAATDVPCNATEFCNTGRSMTTTSVAVGTVVAGMALLQIVLLAGPAMAVGARRNQRTLALVAAAGGERRHLRRFVLGQAFVVGVGGSVVAAALGAGGVAIWLSLGLARDQATVPRVDVHLLDLAALVLAGGLTAVLAALIPARAASRMDVVSALTDRRGQAPPRLRVPLAGLLVAAAGLGIGLFGAQRGDQVLVTAGIALGELGLVAAVGAVVSLAARLSRRFPPATRLALRDAARQRGRTAPAVAAVMAAVAGTVAGLLFVASQDDHDRRAYEPSAASGVVMVSASYDDGPMDGNWTAVEAGLRRTLPVATLVPLASGSLPAHPDASVVATNTPGNECPVDLTAEQTVAVTDHRCIDGPLDGNPTLFGPMNWVDDGSGLRLLTGSAADAAALAAGKVLVSDPDVVRPDGTVQLQLTYWGPNDTEPSVIPGVRVPAQLATADLVTGVPVLPPAVAEQLGLTTRTGSLAASTTRLPTRAEEDRARTVVNDVLGYDSLSLERGYRSDYGLGLLALLVASALVTLVGTFTAVGLAVAEGRADVATLAAVGASPGVRRRLVAAQAGTVAGLGVVLGAAAGGYAGYVLVRLQEAAPVDVWTTPWHLVVPWAHLATVLLALPLLAVAVGFLGVRSKLGMTRRMGQ